MAAVNEEGFFEVEGTEGGLLKKILVEGKGEETPTAGSQVSVHYVGTLHSDGSKFDSSRDRPGTFEFSVGVGQVIKGWDVGILTMKMGEKCILRCRSDYAYGDHGSPPKIPGGATLNFEVELFAWKEKQKEPWELDVAQRLEAAEKSKLKGTEAFKAGGYIAAAQAYAYGVKLMVNLDSANGNPCSPEQAEAGKALELVCNLNHAMALLKAEQPTEAIDACTRALEIDPKSIKGLFRKGQAHAMEGDFDEAMVEYQKVLKVDPENADAKRELKKSTAAFNKQKADQKKLYAGMGALFGAKPADPKE